MPGDFIRRLPQFSFETFDAFRNDRPKEEKWELIDGVPMMTPPPTLVHQRIARAILELINARLARSRPERVADMEIGILLPDDDRFNPEPDVTVIDADIELGQIYAAPRASISSPRSFPKAIVPRRALAATGRSCSPQRSTSTSCTSTAAAC